MDKPEVELKVVKACDIPLKYGEYPKLWKANNGEFYVSQSPVANCQHCSIGGFEYMLDCCDVRAQLREIRTLMGIYEAHRNFIVDISSIYNDQILDLFTKEEILLNTEYLSSNGSIRRMLILNPKK